RYPEMQMVLDYPMGHHPDCPGGVLLPGGRPRHWPGAVVLQRLDRDPVADPDCDPAHPELGRGCNPERSDQLEDGRRDVHHLSVWLNRWHSGDLDGGLCSVAL